MQDIQTFIVNGMYFIIDLATLFLVMASIAILVYAVTTMVKNRQPRWDNLLFIPAALFLFALGLQVLPPLFMKSARIGLADSRVEADVLREELRGWLPDAIPVPAGDAAEAVNTHNQISIPQPTAQSVVPPTPWVVTATPPPATAQPEISVITVQPTATPPPPTPAPPVCMGTTKQWLPGCILPTPVR